ncbi:hypothetical protein Tco_0813150 [Tanacetum coccineum]
MDLETAQTTIAKLPNLKQGEYDMWRLRIEQYFQIQDYALWDIIENENSFKPVPKTTEEEGTSITIIPGPVSANEKLQKKNDVKARSMLLMALPNEHLLTFNQYKDAQTLFVAIQTRFSSNEATKKTQKTLLKQIYKNFSENISQEDLNLKFLRSLPSEWNTHVVVWRNKPNLDIMSFDDLNNNFKIVKQEVRRTTTLSLSSSSSYQNIAFVSFPGSTNEINTAYGVSTASPQVNTASTQVSTANLSDATVYAFLADQPNGSHLVYEDLEQIHEDDIEEMDLKWQLALLSLRARREYRGPRNHDGRNINQDNSRKTMNVEDTSSKAMMAIDGVSFDGSYMAEDEVPTNMALMAFLDSKVHNDKTCSITCLKNDETLKKQYDDLRIEFHKSKSKLADYKRGLASVEEQLVFYRKNEAEFEAYEPKTSNNVRGNTGAPIIEDWEYDSDEDDKPKSKVGNPETKLKDSVRLNSPEDRKPKFEGYGPKSSKKDRENTGAPIIEDWESDDEESKPKPKVVKKTVESKTVKKDGVSKTIFPIAAKIEFVRPQQ